MSDPEDPGSDSSLPNSPQGSGSAEMIPLRYPRTGAPPPAHVSAHHDSTGPDFPRFLTVISPLRERIDLQSVISERTVMLVYRPDIDIARMLAEIVWVDERLEPTFPCVVIGPEIEGAMVLTSTHADRVRRYHDLGGAVARRLSPSAPRTAYVVDPDGWHMTEIQASDAVFSMGREVRDTDDRGNDHVIDLGDVFR